jgi:formamidopyrimidine-DNA glycosylase
VTGRRVIGIERRGKHQLLRLDDDSVLHVHFRMAGDWSTGRADEIPRHARAVLVFTDGSSITLVDPRALSTIAWFAPGAAALPELGPDANDPAFDADSLGRALATRRGPVKPVLLDQRVVAGLGNIYVAEALWRARISPTIPARELGRARRARLVDAIRETLADAIQAPGRYARGETVDAMNVYGREAEPCPRCGAEIRRAVQAGRSTYFCPRCQAR